MADTRDTAVNLRQAFAFIADTPGSQYEELSVTVLI